ncbi:4-O-dimethylallyl-L-tyrosine synthase [Penicillium rolfsii]|nr:4-O-dimethylallyl-L-tyrosine synthase [Penicillium rolfsii]
MASTLSNFFVKLLFKGRKTGDEKGTQSQETLQIRSDEADPPLWYNEIGTTLRDMLESAGYPSKSIQLHTNFFRTSVAPSLGPHPRGTGAPTIWKSFMTDDCTPVELSWCWSTSLETPTVRYSVEPIGRLAGQAADPINTAASIRLLGETLPLARDLDLYLHRYFQRALTSNTANCIDTTGAVTIPLSQTFMAFDLLEETVVAKQYYLPGWKALKEAKSKFSLVNNAIQNLPPLAGALLSSFDVFVEFLESFPTERRPTVEILAVDCLDPVQSRIKIYVRNRETTFKSVMKMLTFGGRSPKTQEEEQMLRELWCAVLGLDEGTFEHNQPLRENEHLTGGILYYYEFKSGAAMPKTKVYLPVRHYAEDDDQIARGLSHYLDRRGKRLTTGSYYDGVQRLCKHRNLASGLGFHSYITWASENNKWNLTAYFNPEIYHPSRSTA